MSFLRNLKIRTKLICGFSLMIFLLLITGYAGHSSSSHLFDNMKLFYSVELPKMDFLIEADRDLQQLLVAERTMIFADHHDGLFNALLDDYETNLTQVKERMDKFSRLSPSPRSQDLYRQFLAALQAWEPVSRQVVEKVATDPRAASALSLGEALDKFEKARDYIDQLTEVVLDEATQSELIAAAKYRSSTLTILITVCAAVLIAVLVSWFISNSINKPLKKAVGMLHDMTRGRLDQKLQLDTMDEIGLMGRTMDEFVDSMQHDVVRPLQMLANGDLTFNVQPADSEDILRNAIKKVGEDLNHVFAQLQSAGQQVNAGSLSVSDAAQSLSQGATESAASMEQINSSMDEIGGKIQQTAKNATQADTLADEARHAADNGNQQMTSMVAAMAEINDAGENIRKIIKVIDEIAFQTNLLALNAAVEAARAGQHGKGFAVVAEEVRNLAARSAKAASETAELIEGSAVKTANGSQIAQTTAESLTGIVESVTKVSALIAEIATASNEQSQGISQINQALGQIDNVIQQTTANAEESAATSEQLSSQAVELQQMLSKFKLAASAFHQSLPQPKVEPALPLQTHGLGWEN
nr:methyl-accepting chemotaxis protein [uncultured Desulfuromonas sp.]